MRPTTRSLLLFVVFLIFVMPVTAQDAVREEMLVTTDWLAKNIRQTRIIHVGQRDEYEAGHIPGAVFIDAASLVMWRDGNPNELPPVP